MHIHNQPLITLALYFLQFPQIHFPHYMTVFYLMAVIASPCILHSPLYQMAILYELTISPATKLVLKTHVR